MLKRGFRLALVQLSVTKDKAANLDRAATKIREAKEQGANVIALPECFNSPYGTKYFAEYAESVPGGPTCEMLSSVAKEHGVIVVGGTFPERIESGALFNTCTVWGVKGELLAKYRKMHLFDIDIPGGVTFKESDVLSPGNETATFMVDDCKIGIGICYDLRFEELARIYRNMGCEMLIYPGAFNMTTGPLHWELLQRGRANDLQLYIAAISPARGKGAGYIAYGHSQITNPWGKIIGQAKDEEIIVYGDIDLTECDKVRQQIPVFSQRRTDVYSTTLLSTVKGKS